MTIHGALPEQPATTAAAAHVTARLRYGTDPSDVAAARAAGADVLVLDVRDRRSWDQGHVPGALHLPRREIVDRLGELPPPDEDPDLVAYCWGPGGNGSTRAVLALSQAGYRSVREMAGGFEYWAREGLSVQTASGRTRRPVDERTAPVPADGR